MERLRELRKEQKLTLDELGAAIGISRQVLSRYERGEREADYETLKALSKHFCVSIDYLLGNSSERENTIVSDQAFPLTSLELQLVLDFRKLGPEMQNYVTGIVHNLAGNA